MLTQYSDILTPKEVMEILFIGKNTLYSLLNSGRIDGFRIGNRWRVTKESVLSYLKMESD